MELEVAHRYARIAPRKARLVVDMIRGASVNEAFDMLRLTRKRAAPMVVKLLKSAVATAVERFDADADDLVISKAWVDGGPMRKGWWARPRGQAARMRYRSSHIHLVVSAPDETAAQEGAPAKTQKKEA